MLNKKHWLEKHGWEVHIISAAYIVGRYKIDELDSFRKENIPVLRYAPFLCPKHIVDRVLDRMVGMLGIIDPEDEILIESHMGSTALWGELLASRLQAKNIIALINESFDEIAFKNRKDYFFFKYCRKELFGGPRAHALLFEGYDKYSAGDPIRTFRLVEKPVQDVDNENLQKIESADCTICYIGRTAKTYFPNIVRDVNQFAQAFPEKRVQFVIVGDIEGRRDLIKSAVAGTDNLHIVPLGDLFPLPRRLFAMVDVCIGGSGSAKCAAYEGVPTIVADPDTNRSNGLLGYDTIKAVGWDGESIRMSFYDALVEVLIKDSYRGKVFRMPPDPSADEAFSQNMELIAASDSDKAYYPVDAIMENGGGMVGRLKTSMAFYMPDILFPLVNYWNRKKGI